MYYNIVKLYIFWKVKDGRMTWWWCPHKISAVMVAMATGIPYIKFYPKHIFPFLWCWEVIFTFWAIVAIFSWTESFSWAFWHQNHKNRPMFDKMRTERWNYATKTKWPPIESQIFNIVRFQQNMTQIVPFIIPIKKANRHKFLK